MALHRPEMRATSERTRPVCHASKERWKILLRGSFRSTGRNLPRTSAVESVFLLHIGREGPGVSTELRLQCPAGSLSGNGETKEPPLMSPWPRVFKLRKAHNVTATQLRFLRELPPVEVALLLFTM